MADTQASPVEGGRRETLEDCGCHDVDTQTRELERLRTGERPLADLAAMRAAAHAMRNRQAQTLVLELTTITPVYGGGTKPGEVDLLVPFRPRAIKNGIRHWWWLLNRHAPAYRIAPGDDAERRLAKKQALYDAMVDIWGGAAREGEESAAKVSVEVSDVRGVKVAPYSAYRVVPGNQGFRLQDDSQDPWLYALFGARGERDLRANVQRLTSPWAAKGATFAERYAASDIAAQIGEQRHLFKSDPEKGPEATKSPCRLIVPGAAFALKLRLRAELNAAQSEQVRLALAFWLAFGGVGARTSRGLGRLACNETAFDAWSIVETAARAAGARMNLVPCKLHPGAGDDLLREVNAVSPERSIVWLLGAYRRFRQSRQPGNERPGRSHWQKAEVVRRATPGYHYPGHRTRLPLPFTNDWVPEMLFGAPIVVSFHGEDDPSGPAELVFAEPGDEGEALNRYASPIFLGARRVSSSDQVVWQPYVLYLHAVADFAGRKLQVRVKQPGPSGATLRNIPAGTWWIDFDAEAQERSAQQKTRTAAFGALPKPAGVSSLIEVFLNQVRSGKSKP